MKTKNIFKALALAMLMPAMLLTTACSSEDDSVNNTANTENTINKGYALPVTVNVTRQGDGATRASYNESTRKLEFSDGDKLFVEGSHIEADRFAGTLTWQSGGTFSGTIYTERPYEGTAAALFTSASPRGTLLPAGYGSYDYLEIIDEGYEARLGENANNSFATSKKLGVEQLSFETGSYTSGTGFVLMPQNAILNFTITGLTASTKVTASLSDGDPLSNIEGEVTTNESGTATFAIGLGGSSDLNEFSLTVGGKSITLVSSSKPLEAGHVYNISRSMPVVTWNSSKVAGIDIVSGDPEYNSFESDGITVAAFAENGSYFMDSEMSVDNGYFTFTSSVGKIKKIEINYTDDLYWDEPSDGWSLVDGTFTWSGTPATSVTLSSSGLAGIVGITSIVFTLE